MNTDSRKNIKISEASLFEGESAIKTDLDRDGDTLFITFGGISQGIGMPRFEFYRITQSLPAKLVFIRDFSQAWYHLELPDIGIGPQAIAKVIEQLKKTTNAKKIVCIGNSMGGYAALLIGSLVQADQVIAFAPQTFISKWLRWLHKDDRWEEQICNVRQSNYADKKMFDLKGYLNNPGYSNAIIFADKENKLDAIHAKRLCKVKDTSIRWVSGGHSLVKELRNSGELSKILNDACPLELRS